MHLIAFPTKLYIFQFCNLEKIPGRHPAPVRDRDEFSEEREKNGLFEEKKHRLERVPMCTLRTRPRAMDLGGAGLHERLLGVAYEGNEVSADHGKPVREPPLAGMRAIVGILRYLHANVCAVVGKEFV